MLSVFLWAVIYEITYIISQTVSSHFNAWRWFTPLAMLLYICIFLVWIYVTGRNCDIALGKGNVLEHVSIIYMLPLLVLPICNIVMGKGLQVPLYTAVYLVSASIAEEIFFRGFLLHYFSKKSKAFGIVFTSVLFAILHLSNLVHCKDVVYIVLQVLCALVMGICYSEIVILYKSLLPCFVAHIFTNITGVNTVLVPNYGEMRFLLWIVIVFFAGYGFYLYRKIR